MSKYIMAVENLLVHTERSALYAHSLPNEWVNRMHEITTDLDGVLDHHPEIRIFGRVAHQNRSIGFFSDQSIGYRYSGQLAASKPMRPLLIELLTWINQRFGAEYNGILVNKYENGTETIGAHSDDERALDPNTGVIILSVGAVRTFRIRNKSTKEMVANVPTDPTIILQMAGDFQKEFTHEIPAEKKVNEVRYSFTFRRHLE